MNSIVREYFPITEPEGLVQSLAPFFREYQALRDQLMEILTDDDLGYRVGGANPSLGELCREIGEIERSYIESFKTFRQDFGYRNADPRLESSVAALSSWYAELDSELRAAIEGLSEDDIANRKIDRSDQSPAELLLRVQLDIYKEALLIFYGRVRVYLGALGKTLPQQWQEWIG
jgi:uncharacterized damage-inducible protein DinB